MHPELEKNLKHNIVVNLLDGGFFGMAMGFASFSTIVPLFVSSMTDSAILIGLIAAIHSTGWQLPQLFTARIVARQKRYKPMVLLITIQERLPFLGLAIIAWFLGDLGKPAALLLTFLMLIWQGLGGGFTANAWQSLIGKIIPYNQRTTFIGLQAAASSLFASVSAILAGLLLEKLAGPLDFTLCFLLACVFMVISWFSLALTREPESPPLDMMPGTDSLWHSLGKILRQDSNFCWFLAARSLTQLAVMGFNFYIVYAVRIHGVGEAEAGILTSVLLAIQIIANPVMGWLSDHWSKRGVMEVGLLAAAISALLAWWAPSSIWFYPVVVLAGIAVVAVWTVGLSMIQEFGSDADRPAYIGMANTLVAPANILAPFFGGWLADLAGYPATFMVSAIAGVATVLVFQFLVRDPRKLGQPAM